MSTTRKKFLLDSQQITQIVFGFGSCIATDRITVDGASVGYCYREAADSNLDSGWRFFAGDEDEDYLSDSARFGLYDVNTIANYDSAIVSILDSEVGTKFARDAEGVLRVEAPSSPEL